MYLHHSYTYLFACTHGNVCNSRLELLTSLVQSVNGERGFSLTGPHIGSVAVSLPSKTKTRHNRRASLSTVQLLLLWEGVCASQFAHI